MTTRKALEAREVVEEAAALLNRVSFDPERGANIGGHHVAVLVEPHVDEPGGRMAVSVACYAFGNRRVEWSGWPIFVVPVDSAHPGRVITLSERGEGSLAGLPPVEHHLSASPCWGNSGGPLNIPAIGPWTAMYSSSDRRVWTTLAVTGTGQLIAEVETSDPAWAGARVRIGLGARGTFRSSAEVRLTPIAATAARWAGRWTREPQGLAAAGPQDELHFCVIPPEERDMKGGAARDDSRRD